MSMSYRAVDARRAFVRLRDAARAAGIETSRWALAEGSQINGRAYRLFEVDARGAQADAGLGLPNGYLGDTAREAGLRMDAIACGLRAAVEARRAS